MIYNLSEYIRTNSSIVPITNGFNPDSNSTGSVVMLNQTGGSDNNTRGLKVDYSVQVMSRAKSQVEAYTLINTVFDLLENRFNIDLPAVTVDSVVYPLITVGQILPIQEPGYIGSDNNGRHMWSVNFTVTLRR